MSLILDYCCDDMRHSVEESHIIQLEINDDAEPDFYSVIMVESVRKGGREKMERDEESGKLLPTQMGHAFNTELLIYQYCPFCSRYLH